MKTTEALRLFGLNNLVIETEIRRVEKEFGVDFGHRKEKRSETENVYYPQFKEQLREEAASMASHYAIFYCLENSIRELIVKRLEEVHGGGWWDIAVPEVVRKNADGNRKKRTSNRHNT